MKCFRYFVEISSFYSFNFFMFLSTWLGVNKIKKKKKETEKILTIGGWLQVAVAVTVAAIADGVENSLT